MARREVLITIQVAESDGYLPRDTVYRYFLDDNNKSVDWPILQDAVNRAALRAFGVLFRRANGA